MAMKHKKTQSNPTSESVEVPVQVAAPTAGKCFSVMTMNVLFIL